MRGVTFLGERKLQLAEFPDPEPGPREVIIQIQAFGMCGSDLNTEQPPDLIQSAPVLRRHLPADRKHLFDKTERRAPNLGIGRKHRGKGGECRFRIDEQHVELLAYQRLKGGKGQIAMSLANAAHRFEAAFVDGGARHAGVEEPTDNGLTQAACRNARLELGNPIAQKLGM
jgi:hypothetical protein